MSISMDLSKVIYVRLFDFVIYVLNASYFIRVSHSGPSLTHGVYLRPERLAMISVFAIMASTSVDVPTVNTYGDSRRPFTLHPPMLPRVPAGLYP
ncbi:hypothetical protein PTI98_013146 [Pleurotus ostreatus]|nr:hypothetical protein PTI98_013146 [Pleurotus ostreatus]